MRVAHTGPVGAEAPPTMFMTCTYAQMRPDLWLGRAGVPVMVVASNYLSRSGRLRIRPTPAQCRPLFVDCGGFYFALKGRDFPFSHAEYTAWLQAMKPDFAASWDYPCEAEIAADDGAVYSRQCRTVAHARVLLPIPASWQWVPVLQGRTAAQYLSHAAMYRSAGLVRPLMGIGSLCRRTRAADIGAIVGALAVALPGVRFHLFGVKSGVLRQRGGVPSAVYSTDTGAWNGMFGKGRTAWKEAQKRGLTQVEYEVWEALPTYAARVVALLDRAAAGVE